MSEYTSMTLKTASVADFQRVKIAYQSKIGKAITVMDLFDMMVKQFEERELNESKKDI